MENKTNKIKRQGKLGSGSYWYFFYYVLLPKIGNLLLVIITFVPSSIISMIYTSLFPVEETESIEVYEVIALAIVISTMIISTWWWLHYLERKFNLSILLPIPLIKIRLKWIIYPFMLPFFGIRRLFRNINAKQPLDNSTSPTTDGNLDNKQ